MIIIVLILIELCIGSSLTVTPESDIHRRVTKRKQKLIIVNLQCTPLYDRATINIHAYNLRKGQWRKTIAFRCLKIFRINKDFCSSSN